MNVLAITYAFAPLRFPATFRLLKWCKGLDELGHRMTVVAVEPGLYPPQRQDPDLLALVPPSITVLWTRSREKDLGFRFLRKAYPWSYRWFEPDGKEWLRPTLDRLKSLAIEDFDVLFSCSQPPVCHMVALEVKLRSGIPWVAYFSDPWVDNPYQVATHPRVLRYNAEAEKTVVQAVGGLVFTSPEALRLTMSKYPRELGKASVLTHGYVPDWYDLRPAPAASEGSVRLVSIGNFYGPRSPEPLLRALADLEREPEFRGRLRLDFYGTLFPPHDQLIAGLGLHDRVSCHGVVDYLTSLAIMKQADVLVVIDADTQQDDSVFLPSKLIDYLGAGRPVLGITSARGPTRRVLEETGHTALRIDEPEAVTEALRRIVLGRWKGERAEAASTRFHYRNIARDLVEALQRASTEGSESDSVQAR